MEFQEFVKQRKRLCKSIHNVMDCPLAINGCSYCIEDCFENTQRAEEIVAKWVSEHPLITNRQKFKEVFGVDAPDDPSKCLWVKCPEKYEVGANCNNCRYRNFWDQEYEESKNKE